MRFVGTNTVNRVYSMPPDKVYYVFSKSELELIESVIYLEPCLDYVVDKAKPEGDKWTVGFCISDMAEALSALLFSAEGSDKEEEYLKLHSKVKEGFIRSQRLRREISQRQIRKQLDD